MIAASDPADILLPRLAASKPPPPDYYAANLRRLLAWVLATAADLLPPGDRRRLRQVLALDGDSQRLLARLLARQRPWLRRDRLSYGEVRDPAGAIGRLRDEGLLWLNGPAPADALLGLFTAAERRALFPAVAPAPRVAWIRACVARYPDTRIRARIATRTDWLELTAPDWLRRALLLYFGDEERDLSAFVVEDLGLRRYEPLPLDGSQRPFASAAAFARHLRWRRIRQLSGRLAEDPRLADWLRRVSWQPAPHRLDLRERDLALDRLGRWYDRRGDFDGALDCYGRSGRPPARERRVRLLHRLGDAAGRDRLLQRMAVAPAGAEEEDFLRRWRRSPRPLPVAGSRLRLEEGEPRGNVEQYAARLLQGRDGQAWHLENHLPLGVAGLLYWPVIFAPLPEAFPHPRASAPVDLFWPDFAQARGTLIDRVEGECADAAALRHRLLSTWEEKHGISNRLVHWSALPFELVDTLTRRLPGADLARLAATVIRNLYRLRRGFPDLLVIDGTGRYEFVEVKGPGDRLQPAQRVWLRTLAALGLPCRVVTLQR